MTDYVLTLSDGQEMSVVADAMVPDAGALRFTVGTTTTLVVAPRVWKSCRVADATELPFAPPKLPPRPARRSGEILAQAVIDDPLR
jgi:hypothetical protein